MSTEPETTTVTSQHCLTREAVLAALGAQFEQGAEELHERIHGTAKGDDASYTALATELRTLEREELVARRSIGSGMSLWRLAAASAPGTVRRRLV